MSDESAHSEQQLAEKLTVLRTRIAEIEARRLAEAHLLESQKHESIEQLAAGVAHEINTPTQFVGDNVRFLQDSIADIIDLLTSYGALFDTVDLSSAPEDLLRDVSEAVERADVDYLRSEIPKATEQTVDGVRRIADVASAMKELGQHRVGAKTLSDFNKIVESAVMVARNEWKYIARLEMELEPNLPPVPLLPEEFLQAIVSLIANAAHAIEDDDGNERGSIRVTTRRESGSACVEVEDTGIGIPASDKPRIFDPFFTTKDVGRGKGQGLTTTRNVIINKHGGEISVQSAEGKGTVITLRVPLSDVQGRAA